MMYRKSCNCNCNNNAVESEYENCYEESCSDVQNTMDIYDDCGCGYGEEFSYFQDKKWIKHLFHALD